MIEIIHCPSDLTNVSAKKASRAVACLILERSIYSQARRLIVCHVNDAACEETECVRSQRESFNTCSELEA